MVNVRTPRIRVVVHPTSKGWTWTQLSRNNKSQAVAPAEYDNRDSAKRAGERQVAAFNSVAIAYSTGQPQEMPAVLVVDVEYRRY
jgi:hypothetical protein